MSQLVAGRDHAHAFKPKKVLATVRFMAKIGSIRQSPKSIDDLVFRDIAGLRSD